MTEMEQPFGREFEARVQAVEVTPVPPSLELHPRHRLSPAEVLEAIETTAHPHDEHPEVDVQAWDTLKRAAGDYVKLIDSNTIRPVGKGVVGIPIDGRLIHYCFTHGWASEESFCYFQDWSTHLLKPWRRWGKGRKAKAQCNIYQVMLFSPEPFE